MKIINSKLQITNYKQILNYKFQTHFGHWGLDIVWVLVLVIWNFVMEGGVLW